MALITPNVPREEELKPNRLCCRLCRRPLYWEGQGRPSSLVIQSSLITPETSTGILKLLTFHNLVMQMKIITDGTIICPYYVVLVDGPSWSSSIPLCNDCWENHLLDLLSLLEKEFCAKIRIILTDYETWGKDFGERQLEDPPSGGGRESGEQ